MRWALRCMISHSAAVPGSGLGAISEMGELRQDAESESGGEDAEHNHLPRE